MVGYCEYFTPSVCWPKPGVLGRCHCDCSTRLGGPGVVTSFWAVHCSNSVDPGVTVEQNGQAILGGQQPWTRLTKLLWVLADLAPVRARFGGNGGVYSSATTGPAAAWHEPLMLRRLSTTYKIHFTYQKLSMFFSLPGTMPHIFWEGSEAFFPFLRGSVFLWFEGFGCTLRLVGIHATCHLGPLNGFEKHVSYDSLVACSSLILRVRQQEAESRSRLERATNVGDEYSEKLSKNVLERPIFFKLFGSLPIVMSVWATMTHSGSGQQS